MKSKKTITVIYSYPETLIYKKYYRLFSKQQYGIQFYIISSRTYEVLEEIIGAQIRDHIMEEIHLRKKT